MSVLPAWPGLADGRVPTAGEMRYERGVWGKVPAARSDFRWIARSPRLPDGLERAIRVGSEDRLDRFVFWRSLSQEPEGALHVAGSVYPSRATDAAGRSGFLEKQLVAWWRPDDVPAAAAALLFLPHVASWTDAVWWRRREDPRFEDGAFALALGDDDLPSLVASAERVEEVLRSGLNALRATKVTATALTETYAALLAGRHGVALSAIKEPPSPQALACLLLPLPRARADRLSLSWCAARRLDDQTLAAWDLLLGPLAKSGEATVGREPSGEERERAERMAAALLAGDPTDLAEPGASPRRRPTGPAVEDAPQELELVLWGPSSAGKTVLLAQLYLQRDASADWRLAIESGSLAFVNAMTDRVVAHNRFPLATNPGTVEKLGFRFAHPKRGIEVRMRVEDRAGKDWEDHEGGVLDRLVAAHGIVLLLDPERDLPAIEKELRATLARVHLERGLGARLDDRPVAICLSKADLAFGTAADLDRARRNPHGFVRHHPILRRLLPVLDNHLARYRLFPLSAVGVRTVHGVLDHGVFYDESLAPRLKRLGEPVNLLEPFAWVLDELTGGAADGDAAEAS